MNISPFLSYCAREQTGEGVNPNCAVDPSLDLDGAPGVLRIRFGALNRLTARTYIDIISELHSIFDPEGLIDYLEFIDITEVDLDEANRGWRRLLKKFRMEIIVADITATWESHGMIGSGFPPIKMEEL